MRKKVFGLVVIGAIVFILVGGAGYFMLIKKSQQPILQQQTNHEFPGGLVIDGATETYTDGLNNYSIEFQSGSEKMERRKRTEDIDPGIIRGLLGAIVEDVRTIFERRNDTTIYIPDLAFREN